MWNLKKPRQPIGGHLHHSVVIGVTRAKFHCQIQRFVVQRRDRLALAQHDRLQLRQQRIREIGLHELGLPLIQLLFIHQVDVFVGQRPDHLDVDAVKLGLQFHHPALNCRQQFLGLLAMQPG